MATCSTMQVPAKVGWAVKLKSFSNKLPLPLNDLLSLVHPKILFNPFIIFMSVAGGYRVLSTFISLVKRLISGLSSSCEGRFPRGMVMSQGVQFHQFTDSNPLISVVMSSHRGSRDAMTKWIFSTTKKSIFSASRCPPWRGQLRSTASIHTIWTWNMSQNLFPVFCPYTHLSKASWDGAYLSCQAEIHRNFGGKINHWYWFTDNWWYSRTLMSQPRPFQRLSAYLNAHDHCCVRLVSLHLYPPQPA